MNRAATTLEIQGLYGHANSEGRFYLLLAQVQLAKFLETAKACTNRKEMS